ncbi:MAG TPA: DUF5615 family PIN-like protein [Thermomicrobiales bacterium]|nr:DUF5615 family PIN-like protein [Thermomicrobiales bacterium]
MRFLLDDSADGRLQATLRLNGHDAILVAHAYGPAVPDHEILAHADGEDRVLITCDRDFGELIVKHLQRHRGVILYRLGNRSFSYIESRILQVIEHYADQLDQFIIVTDKDIRVR